MPSFLSIKPNNYKIAELLLKNGADINERDDNNDTALVCMAQNENIKGTEWLRRVTGQIRIKMGTADILPLCGPTVRIMIS